MRSCVRLAPAAAIVSNSTVGAFCRRTVGKATMRFPMRRIVFCCVSLAMLYSSAAIVHTRRKHPVAQGHVGEPGVSCKAVKSYGDCELLDVVLTKAGNHRHRHGSAGGRISHTCAWCKRGAYEFCTSCSNLDNLEGIGVMCQPFARDTKHLCNRKVAAKPAPQRKQSRIDHKAFRFREGGQQNHTEGKPQQAQQQQHIQSTAQPQVPQQPQHQQKQEKEQQQPHQQKEQQQEKELQQPQQQQKQEKELQQPQQQQKQEKELQQSQQKQELQQLQNQKEQQQRNNTQKQQPQSQPQQPETKPINVQKVSVPSAISDSIRKGSGEDQVKRRQRARERYQRFLKLKKLKEKQFFCPIDRMEIIGETTNTATSDAGVDHYQKAIMEVEKAAAHIGIFAGIQDPSTTLQPSLSASYEISDPEKIPFRPPMSHFFSDIDGRADYGVMATPGGDLGAFLILLSSVERQQESFDKLLSFENVYEYFQRFLSDMAQYGKLHFAMTMDEKSLERLAKYAEVYDALKPISAEEEARVVAQSVRPEAISSEYLRFIVAGNGMKIRPQLCGHAIQSFWKLYFDHRHPLKPKLLMPILKGDHNEKGIIVSYNRNSNYHCHGQAPLLVPKVGTSQYYIYHLGATERFFEGLALWASKTVGGNSAVPKIANGLVLPTTYSSTLYKDMQVIADQAWKRTIDLLSNQGNLEKFRLTLTSYKL